MRWRKEPTAAQPLPDASEGAEQRVREPEHHLRWENLPIPPDDADPHPGLVLPDV